MNYAKIQFFLLIENESWAANVTILRPECEHPQLRDVKNNIPSGAFKSPYIRLHPIFLEREKPKMCPLNEISFSVVLLSSGIFGIHVPLLCIPVKLQGHTSLLLLYFTFSCGLFDPRDEEEKKSSSFLSQHQHVDDGRVAWVVVNPWSCCPPLSLLFP